MMMSLVDRICRRPDVVLALLVAGLVGMLVVPLPALALDALISVNLAAGVLILCVALFTKTPLELSTFPSLLLVTTLFRLGLNVSTTRGILAHASAGEVVEWFGAFVLQGDVVVGVVVFLVITLVQFLVIAKGAERVAEVCARFTLDALPGKQMSIDADLRQGALTEAQAKEARRRLGRESQLFGNMDGAMKFVKGDAIAGLVITALNIVAGFGIGVVREGLSLDEALTVYSILTVGDGLVSQIPALLITLSAGVLVTRVEPEKESSNLGLALQYELLGNKSVLGVSSAVMLALALVPGLPALPFIGIAAGLLFTLFVRGRDLSQAEGSTLARREAFEAELDEKVAQLHAQDGLADRLTPSAVPVELELGAQLSEHLGFVPGAHGICVPLLSDLLPDLRDALFLETGVPFPRVRVEPFNPALPPAAFCIRIRGVPVHEKVVDPERCLAMVPPRDVQRLGVQVEATRDPLGNTACSVAVVDRDVLEASGVTVWDAAGAIALEVGCVLRSHARDFIGLHEVSQLLDRLAAAYPRLVEETVPKVVSRVQVVDVVRRLVDERVSIRDFKTVVEALAEHGPYATDGVFLTEQVRGALGNQLAHVYAAEGGLNAVLLDPMIEDTIESAIHRDNVGACLALEPELGRTLLEAIGAAIAPMVVSGVLPTILTRADLRRYVRKLIELEMPEVAVLSFDELPAQIVVHPMGRATIAEAA